MNYSNHFNNHNGRVSDKWDSYLDHYDNVLQNFQPDVIVEVGVQNGGSLEIWDKVYPSAKKIIGIDILEACRQLEFSSPRIQVIVGDASHTTTKSKIQEIAKTPNLIIDDGSHLSRDIIKTFINLYPLLADGGKYIIEDLHASYWPEFEGGLFFENSSISFLKKLVDVINFDHWDQAVSIEDLLGTNSSLGNSFVIEDILFSDSFCVISKPTVTGKPKASRLGLRRISGTDAEVNPNVVNLDLTHHARSSKTPVSQEGKEIIKGTPISRLIAENEHLAAEKDRMEQSFSWRITKPLRMLAKPATKFLSQLRGN